MSFNITQPELDLVPSFTISGGDGAEYQQEVEENKEHPDDVSEAVENNKKEQLPLEPQIYPKEVTKESKRRRRQGECIKSSNHLSC